MCGHLATAQRQKALMADIVPGRAWGTWNTNHHRICGPLYAKSEPSPEAGFHSNFRGSMSHSARAAPVDTVERPMASINVLCGSCSHQEAILNSCSGQSMLGTWRPWARRISSSTNTSLHNWFRTMCLASGQRGELRPIRHSGLELSTFKAMKVLVV